MDSLLGSSPIEEFNPMWKMMTETIYDALQNIPNAGIAADPLNYAQKMSYLSDETSFGKTAKKIFD
jgi:hypothetical protein